jgi:hypothetical protein
MSIFDRPRRGEGDQPAPSSSQANDADIESVEGERGVSAVQQPPSLQSRLSNILALGLMGTLGVGFLGWYYAKTLGHSLERALGGSVRCQGESQRRYQSSTVRPSRSPRQHLSAVSLHAARDPGRPAGSTAQHAVAGVGWGTLCDRDTRGSRRKDAARASDGAAIGRAGIRRQRAPSHRAHRGRGTARYRRECSGR